MVVHVKFMAHRLSPELVYDKIHQGICCDGREERTYPEHSRMHRRRISKKEREASHYCSLASKSRKNICS